MTQLPRQSKRLHKYYAHARARKRTCTVCSELVSLCSAGALWSVISALVNPIDDCSRWRRPVALGHERAASVSSCLWELSGQGDKIGALISLTG